MGRTMCYTAWVFTQQFLQQKHLATLNMTKKRSKSKVSQASDPTANLEQTCIHLRKGLEQGNLKKSLPEAPWDTCQDCQTDNKAKEKDMEEETVEAPSIWLCLKCGHRGCDRNSEEKHALQHYNTPRSDCHCLVLNLDNWSVWCYLCDDEVPYSSSTRLGQLVDYVRKERNKQTRVQASKILLTEQENKEPENKELENKKLEKDSSNEKEKVKHVSQLNEVKATVSMGTTTEMTVKGFSNLGNTCFFNAVMQNLSQTPVLRELLKEVKMTGTTVTVQSLDSPPNEPLVIKVEQLPGSLTTSMCQFLTDIVETKNGTVTPKELFSQVCKKAVRFRGYQQQDSQELLRYLLDGMRAEEIQRLKAGIMKHMKNLAEKIENEEEIKKKVNEYEKRRAIPNFVDRIFGGELSSTIMCNECRTVSLVHESFLDLSLPVLDEQTGKKGAVPKNASVVPITNTEEDDDNESYVKEKNEPSSATSKHLQKKAKKQAKKQAKNQRRQFKVLPLNEIATAEGDSEEHQDGYAEQSTSASHLENDQHKHEVQDLVQSVEHSLVLINKDNETDALRAENGSSQLQPSVETVIQTEDTLQIIAATSEDVESNNSPILDESTLSLREGNPPLHECNHPCLEKVNYCLEGDSFSGEKNSTCLEKVSPHLKITHQCVEGDIPCCGKGRSFLEEDRPSLLEECSLPCLDEVSSCLKNSPCLKESHQCKEHSCLCSRDNSPCLEKNSPCLEGRSPCLKEDKGGTNLVRISNVPNLDEGNSSLEEIMPVLEKNIHCLVKENLFLEERSEHLNENGQTIEEGITSLDGSSSSLESRSPSLETSSPSVERDNEAINDLVNGFDEINLRVIRNASEEHENTSCHISETKLYEVVNEDPETAFCTLADRNTINTEECSVETCLYQFTRNEKLCENNKLLCNVCTQKQCNRRNINVKDEKDEKKYVYTNAKKQMLISFAPPILTLHLKRFQQAGVNLRKVNRHIKFPELIDLAPFCTAKCKNVAEGDTKVLYSLYGVVEHSGTMRSGHYTAFVKARQPNTRLADLVINKVVPKVLETEPTKGRWYHISDTHVQDVPLNRVLTSQAYLLFYERIL
ncbi:ubiquitin carboxyl-terminal hydrolase 16 isoform X1 [Pleurodeles waltl]|uniref:ubiquitin carboxyl-terminal hydrolase 16 isoform X1 n=1 Tax=Pleurodeles waltl TaxID=8319 RepID=UPI003709B73B